MSATMMEFSSPLAAMHPPQMPSWPSRRDMPTSRIRYSSGQTSIVPGTFDFRAMHKQQRPPTQDYFSMAPPMRHSSPTVSLAADLSSNFHIDASPQAPTPRRSLFGRDMCLPHENKALLVTPPLSHEGPTTPPIGEDESSPPVDAMDVSPLPHKQPCFVARVTLPSPSPAELTREDAHMDSPEAGMASYGPPPAMVLSPAQAAIDRKRTSASSRPSLLRTKMHSTTSVPAHHIQSRPSHALLPAFQFGQPSSRLRMSSSSSSLTDSPISEHADENLTGSPITAGTSMRRTTSLTTAPRCDGSPVAGLGLGLGISRKPAVSTQRPRKQVRRSLSMFQHPDEIMNETHDYASSPMQQSQTCDDEPYMHKLPHAMSDEPDSLPRIQQDTLINVMNGQYRSHYDTVLVVDCRFEYEYEGGHINGALNYNDKELLAKQLFEKAVCPRTLLIFHCEYSVHRAPRMAKFVRAQDRTVNAPRYPHLSYPEMYILEGGYSKFFQQHRTLCFPQNYVEMEHKDYEQACERGMGKLKQRAKLSRAQTYAFGQQQCSLEQSPTSNLTCRRAPLSLQALAAENLSPMAARILAPRLASY